MVQGVYTELPLIIAAGDALASDMPAGLDFSPLLPTGVLLDDAVTPTVVVTPALTLSDLAVSTGTVTDADGSTFAAGEGITFQTDGSAVAGIDHLATFSATTDDGTVLTLKVVIEVR